MAQDHAGDAAQMRDSDAVVAVQGGHGPGGADQGQLAAQAVGAERHAEAGGVLQGFVGDDHIGEARAGGDDAFAEFVLRLVPGFDECGGVTLERVAAADDVDPCGQVGGGADFYRQAEAV
jgi:hypothetical protein